MAKPAQSLLLAQAFTSLISESKLSSLRLLALSAMLSAVAVCSILSLSSFMKDTLIVSSSELLAGDRQLESPRALDQTWLDKAHQLGLQSSLAVEFRTMVFSDQGSILVAAKAVDEAYPLKGTLQLETDAQINHGLAQVPMGGSAMPARLFNLLDVEQGQGVYIGEASIIASARLIQEPDVGFNLGGIQPRFLMRLEDLSATNVIQPGSRAKWRYYFAGEQAALALFDTWLEPKLNKTHEYHGIKGGRPTIASAMDKAESYLLLAASLAMFLASLAIALCAKQYAQQQVTNVAILKTLGFSPQAVLALFSYKLLMIWLLALALGLGLSQLIASALMDLLVPLFEGVQLADSFSLHIDAVIISAAITAISVLGFCLPQVIALSRVSPQAVLRPESGHLASGSKGLTLLVCLALFSVLFAYTQSIKLLLLFVVAFIALILLVGVVVGLFIKVLTTDFAKRISTRRPWKISRNALIASPIKTGFQATVYAFALCLLALIFLVRDSLVAQWQAQLPVDAPNHFLVNIREHQVAPIEDLLKASDISVEKVYPMVRGRLSHINQVDVKVAVTKDVGALNRELNLSWAESLPADNEVVEGRWFDASSEGLVEVSIEQELAENIGVNVGDALSFSIGPERLEARVTSIRKVQWDSMRPNFYVFFEPQALDAFPRTYITSFFMRSADSKGVLNALSKAYPTVSILELDALIVKIQAIVAQVSKMLEVVLSLIVGASLLVVSAITAAKLQERAHEANILRSFGLRANTLRIAYFLEFALLGLVAGVTGLLCAELGLNLVTGLFLNGDVTVHVHLWIVFPFLSALLLGLLGFSLLRGPLKQSPMRILR